MLTRADLFRNWLKENCTNPDDCELLDDMQDKSHIRNEHGCFGFFCPEDVPTVQVPINNTTEMEYRVDCSKCPYNEFWTKDISDLYEP